MKWFLQASTTVCLCVLLNSAVSAEEFSLDLSEVAKKPYSLGGFLELKPVLYDLDKDAALYRLKFYNNDQGSTLPEYNARLQLEGSLGKGAARLFIRGNGEYVNSYQEEGFKTTLYEGYLSLKPSTSLAFDIGKRSLRWGKGYAWSPVAFLDRPKDPDDPEVSLEGFYLLTADYIKSFSGPIQTLAVTPVILPVYDHVNDDFGEAGHVNVGAKLYLLAYDTDIDLMVLGGGSTTTRWGIDFSRNITPSFEIHGECAYISAFTQRFVDSAGMVRSDTFDLFRWLAGIRYLTERETTWIIEYYRNGSGYDADQMREYLSFVNQGYQAFLSGGGTTQLNQAANLAASGFGKASPMQEYLYARISQKEPFDILYFTPALTTIVNLQDGSFSASPELLYTGITNLEFRLKGTALVGGRLSEYGEKQNDFRFELRARYYF